MVLALLVGAGRNGAPADAAPADWAFGPIVFFSARGPNGDNEIYRMNPDGSNVQNLTNNPADDRDPTWSVNHEIAFSTNRGTNGNYEIYVMNGDGSNQTNLTNSPENDRDPSWDDNSNGQIWFVREVGDPGSARGVSGEIFVMNSNGSNQTNLTNNPADDREPHNTRGLGVIFASNRGPAGDYEIMRMGSDGSNQTDLTNNAADDREPVMSYTWPEEYQIAFATNRGEGGNNEIFQMSLDGSPPDEPDQQPGGRSAPVLVVER